MKKRTFLKALFTIPAILLPIPALSELKPVINEPKQADRELGGKLLTVSMARYGEKEGAALPTTMLLRDCGVPVEQAEIPADASSLIIIADVIDVLRKRHGRFDVAVSPVGMGLGFIEELEHRGYAVNRFGAWYAS